MLNSPPTWLRRLLDLYDRIPTWVRYTAAALALFLFGAVLL